MAVSSSSEELVDFPIPGFENLQQFSQNVLKSVVTTTRCANELSSLIDDYNYWSSFKTFEGYCKEESARLINDIGELLRHHAVQCSWAPANNSNTKDVEDRFDRLVDANDIILENVGSLLDEAAGFKKNDKPIVPAIIKQSSPIVSSWNKKEAGNKSSTYKLLMAKNIQRPQLKWLGKTNNANTPFQPYIRTKPNAIKPLEEETANDSKEIDVNEFIRKQRVGGTATNISDCCNHPYAYELSQFEPNDWQLEEKPPQHYLAIADTQLTMVDDQEKLDEMLKKLKDVKEIAIDLEHHSYRSFQGFVCLMQLSTRFEDFIVDTLKLRDELYVLNEVFTDPEILKVLHGSDSDIGWLQRDFGLYIVNMFDTGQAARVLGEARFSLSHLLQKYCNVSAQKQYQLADWRIRELPEEMISYAQEDTHYLLYIYDILRNQLVASGNEMKNLLRNVYSKSTAICLTIYHKPMLYPDSHFTLYQKYRGRLNAQKLECFRLLYEWRDKTAREEDESCGYILPNHMLFQIAENLPREPQGIIACCNPCPPLVRQRVMDVHHLVTQARDYDPVQLQPTRSIDEKQSLESVNEATEKARFDAFHTKSGFECYEITGPPIQLKKPSLTIFEAIIKEQTEASVGKKKALEILAMLRSPFEMYQPNTGKAQVEATVINQAWNSLSKEKITNKDNKQSEKRKQKATIVIEDNTTIRAMLPKKRKLNEETRHANESPTKLDYDSNVQKSTDYVPFDYSKADLKKFTSGKSSVTPIEVFNLTEEPKMGKVVRTKVHSKSGSRSMISK